MKTLLIVLFLSQGLLAESTSRILDGVPDFAKWEVNNKVFWEDSEKDLYVASQDAFIGTMVVVITRIIPTVAENNVVVANLSFKNYSDFRDCVDNPDLLKRKRDKIR